MYYKYTKIVSKEFICELNLLFEIYFYLIAQMEVVSFLIALSKLLKRYNGQLEKASKNYQYYCNNLNRLTTYKV
jgi:hypothetical protein